MSTLYDVQADYLAAMCYAEEYAAEHEGEIPADLAERIDQVSLDRDYKLRNCLGYLKGEDAWAKAIDKEISALEARRKRHAANAEWMREYIGACIGTGRKYECAEGRVSWRKSEAVEVSIAGDQLPAKYQRVIPARVEPDKTAIKDALRLGESINGCTLVVRQNIQIK